MGLIWRACPATRDDYFVSRVNEPWDEEGSDVAGTTEDDYSNGRVG